MALTSNCTDMPTLFVDTHVPLDILTDAANYRIRAVTQVLENLSMRGSIECESFILSDFALLCAISLRDGCDVLDGLGGGCVRGLPLRRRRRHKIKRSRASC